MLSSRMRNNISYDIIPCPNISCHIIYYQIFHNILCHIMSYHVTSVFQINAKSIHIQYKFSTHSIQINTKPIHTHCKNNTKQYPACFSSPFYFFDKNDNIAIRAAPRSRIGARSADSAPRGCASGDFLLFFCNFNFQLATQTGKTQISKLFQALFQALIQALLSDFRRFLFLLFFIAFYLIVAHCSIEIIVAHANIAEEWHQVRNRILSFSLSLGIVLLKILRGVVYLALAFFAEVINRFMLEGEKD